MARVTHEEASSLGMSNGQVLVSLPVVLVQGDVLLNVLDLHSSAQGPLVPSHQLVTCDMEEC